MRENKITRTIEEVNGYIAEDGTFFKSKEECEAYEKSAKGVVFSMVKDKMIAKTSVCELFGEGSEDDDIEIFNIDTMEDLKLINQYVRLHCYYRENDKNLLSESCIGKTVLLCWSYDHDWAWYYENLEYYIAKIKKRYDALLSQPQK